MQFIGYDIGSSSIKVSVLDGTSGKCIAAANYPEDEMPISSIRPGWAEQNPEDWWNNLISATEKLFLNSAVNPDLIKAIGISYQMHGLVMIDKDRNVIRPSIIWCDSRAVNAGNSIFSEIGEEKCLDHFLNSPGNFTASKLAWVKENEPRHYEKIYKIMLPGDYIAMKLTGEVNTTVPGLSEGIFWDFKENKIADLILDHFGFEKELVPSIVPTFGDQGRLTKKAAAKLKLKHNIPVAYRAGDQPNNAFSLNVLEPGEIAATAGTSGVVYGVSDKRKYDRLSRINTFAHVNHQSPEDRYGVLLCVNGTGILNAWIRRNMTDSRISYSQMNKIAAEVQIGSEGLFILPFGNGAERMLLNRNIFSQIIGLNFNVHSQKHFFRAAQEGIAFALKYGLDIMEEVGIQPEVIRAGNANMFLSPVFCEAFSNLMGAVIELYNTDGSQGAARGAGYGTDYYSSFNECFLNLNKIRIYEPEAKIQQEYNAIYGDWENLLMKFLANHV